MAFLMRLARFARSLAATSSYELALAVVARRAGVSVDWLKKRRVKRPPWGHLKRQAVYLAVMTGHSRRAIGRAAGLSPEQVANYCERIEAARDDAQLDRVLDELELEMTPEGDRI